MCRSGYFFHNSIGVGRKLVVVNRVIEQPRFHSVGCHAFRDVAGSRGLPPVVEGCRFSRHVSAPRYEQCLSPVAKFSVLSLRDWELLDPLGETTMDGESEVADERSELVRTAARFRGAGSSSGGGANQSPSSRNSRLLWSSSRARARAAAWSVRRCGSCWMLPKLVQRFLTPFATVLGLFTISGVYKTVSAPAKTARASSSARQTEGNASKRSQSA
jgi:hypothetical protein